MQQYMSAMTGNSIETGKPLTNDEIAQHVPAVFGNSVHPGLKGRYERVDTARMLDVMREQGFMPFSAAQAGARKSNLLDVARHMVRFRHESTFRTDSDGTDFEIIMINAHDGNSTYRLLPGLFRFVCANGLMTGETFNTLKIRHNEGAMDNVIEGTYEVLKEAPKVAGIVDEWKGVEMNQEQRLQFAEAAHELRFPGMVITDNLRTAAIAPVDLLEVRREADKANDLWTTFNVIQENMVRGGQEGHLARMVEGELVERHATTRGVASIHETERLNRKLWDMAADFAKAA